MVFGKVSGGLGGPKCKGFWMDWKWVVMCLKPLDRFGVGLELAGTVWGQFGGPKESLRWVWQVFGKVWDGIDGLWKNLKSVFWFRI